MSVAAALLLGAVFAGDSVWTALAALLVAGGWGALALAGRSPLPGGGAVLGGLLLATAAWSGLSIAWSVAPDLSWAELDRTLVYTAFLAVGLLLGAGRPEAARLAAAALTVAFGAGVVWALAGKAIPAVFPDGGRAARLRDPIGYWNALALAADVLLVLALSFAASSRAVAVRIGGAALAYAAVVAVLLAASRAGVAAAVLGIVLWLWLRRDRVEAALLALVAIVPALAVAGWAFTRPALVEDGGSHADRVADGAWFGLLLLAGGVLVALGARELGRRPLPPAGRGRVARLLRGLAVAVALVTVVGLVANAGRIADEFRGEEVRNDPGRFASLSSNNRLAWWGEARDVFEADPLAGAGANSFEVARKRYREIASSVTQPHSVPLQFLAGTGIVGLALLLGLAAAAAAAAVGAVRRLEGGERDAAAALSVALALWLVHALVDYDWDFVAVTGPAFFAAGALAAAGRPARTGTFPFAAAAAGALALAAAAAVVTPWLAQRSVRDVNPALERGDVDAAREAAERARSLDPLSLEPLFARARVEEDAGDAEAALAAYRRAADVQPENSVSWYELGLYEFNLGDRCSAYVHLNRAYTLDPAGLQWEQGSELDQARAWVNEPGNC
ncbi:MAG TPA: O-antigen ligase family protein [Gaiellaceae bacterium]|nr:O-antigen ligase family protein [Gaiellaceae bacterium]